MTEEQSQLGRHYLPRILYEQIMERQIGLNLKTGDWVVDWFWFPGSESIF